MMELREYQMRAIETRKTPEVAEHPEIVPLLGLAGEAGQLLSQYKKFLRDGPSHRLFRECVEEELGDLLWYIADVASRFDLNLSHVAESNLAKCQERWGGYKVRVESGKFDTRSPEAERLPRRFQVQITSVTGVDEVIMRAFVDGRQAGNDLTDNNYVNDGYRFHDIFHFGCAAVLGWSPVARKLLGCKRKSNKQLDMVEDGGRARAIEEGISALVFNYATKHNMLDGITSLDFRLLSTIKELVSHLEVRACSLREWERAILVSYDVWRAVEERGGGTVCADLDARSLSLEYTICARPRESDTATF